jgi:hypothetical protein
MPGARVGKARANVPLMQYLGSLLARPGLERLRSAEQARERTPVILHVPTGDRAQGPAVD